MFSNVEEMNEFIVDAHNSIVNKKDEFYFIGDFSFGIVQETLNILDRLNGKKFMIMGNHDYKHINDAIKRKFMWVKDYYKLRIDGKYKIILFHYPIYSWESKEKGYFHFHGHVHNNFHHDVGIADKLNVGFDVWKKPLSLQECLDELWERQFKIYKNEKMAEFYNQDWENKENKNETTRS